MHFYIRFKLKLKAMKITNTKKKILNENFLIYGSRFHAVGGPANIVKLKRQ